jgi:hypothetical protein
MTDQRSIEELCREQSIWLTGLEIWLKRYRIETQILKQATFPPNRFDIAQEQTLLESANYSGHWRVDPENVRRWKAGSILEPCKNEEL